MGGGPRQLQCLCAYHNHQYKPRDERINEYVDLTMIHHKSFNSKQSYSTFYLACLEDTWLSKESAQLP